MDAETIAAAKAQLAAAQAAGDFEMVAKLSKALEANAGGAQTAKKPNQAAREAPPAPQPGLISRGLSALWSGLGNELSIIPDYLGITEPTATVGNIDGTPDERRRFRLDAADAAMIRGANAFGFSVPNRIVDAMEPRGARGMAREYRENLYSTPGGQRGGPVGDIAGGIASAVIPMAPVNAVGRGLGLATKAIGRALPRAAAPVARLGQLAGKTQSKMAAGAAEGAAVNTLANAADPDSTSLANNLGLAVLLGGGIPGLGGVLGALARRLRGRPDAPTEIGRYRDLVESGTPETWGRGEHPPVPEGTPGYEGGAPHPNDVYNAGVAKGRPAEMRDVRDAAEEAGGQAIEHRSRKAAARAAELNKKLEESGYLDIRIPRQELIDEFKGLRRANTDPDVGEIDESLDAVLGKQQSKLERTRPAPKPVLEGARVPTEQPELALPGAPARPATPEPMAVPTPEPRPQQQREMFPEQPPPAEPPLENETDRRIKVLLESAQRDVAAAEAAKPKRLPAANSGQAARKAYADASQRLNNAQNRLRQAEAAAASKPYVKVVPDEVAPPMEPPMRWTPADPNAGQQLEIASPAPREIPALEPSGGVGPHQERLPLPEPEPTTRPVEEARGDPTLRALRRLRQQARARSNFENKNPTPAELRARAEYFGYDNVIKRAMEKRAPGYLEIEREMGESAHDFRREGDLLAKTEGNLMSGGGVDTPESARQADELDAIVAEDVAEGNATINARAPRGGARGRVRNAKQQGVATFMQRSGDTNTPGKNARASHEDLAARDPEYRRLQQLVEDVKSIEATRFGLRPQVKLDFNQVMANSLTGGEIAKQNLRALGGRLGVPLMEGAAKVAPQAGRLVPALRDPLAALLERRRLEMEQQKKGGKR